MKMSVSLLDILTCGFGGILLLFLTTISVWQMIAVQEEKTSSGQNQAQFVCLIMSMEPDESLFQKPPSEENWDIGTCQVIRKEAMPNFAVLYCKTTPKDLSEIKLTGMNTSQTIRCNVIRDGKSISKKVILDSDTLPISRITSEGSHE